MILYSYVDMVPDFLRNEVSVLAVVYRYPFALVLLICGLLHLLSHAPKHISH